MQSKFFKSGNACHKLSAEQNETYLHAAMSLCEVVIFLSKRSQRDLIWYTCNSLNPGTFQICVRLPLYRSISTSEIAEEVILGNSLLLLQSLISSLANLLWNSRRSGA